MIHKIATPFFALSRCSSRHICHSGFFALRCQARGRFFFLGLYRRLILFGHVRLGMGLHLRSNCNCFSPARCSTSSTPRARIYVPPCFSIREGVFLIFVPAIGPFNLSRMWRLKCVRSAMPRIAAQAFEFSPQPACPAEIVAYLCLYFGFFHLFPSGTASQPPLIS